MPKSEGKVNLNSLDTLTSRDGVDLDAYKNEFLRQLRDLVTTIDEIIKLLFSIDLLEVGYDTLQEISADLGKLSVGLYELRNVVLYQLHESYNYEEIELALVYLQDAQDYLLQARRKQKDEDINIKHKTKGNEITFDEAIRLCREKLMNANDFLKAVKENSNDDNYD